MFIVHRVTVVKDKDTHRSKGVAFVLYLDRESAHKCIQSLNLTEVSFKYINAVSLLQIKEIC
jgi:U11/U12 small nuclear ribonucleoprotein 31 kDa protein